LTLSFDRMAWGLYGTRLVPWKLALMFLGVIVLKWAALNAMKNLVLVMWLM